jgi:hypothetical protein
LTKSENFSKISFNVNTFLIVTSFIWENITMGRSNNIYNKKRTYSQRTTLFI